MQKAIATPKKLSFLALSVLTALSVPAYAAEEPAETRTIVVTATRTEQEVKEIPAAVEVITKEDLEKTGARTLADALKMATSINVSSPGMAGNNVTVRGMSTRHTLILIDGKRLISEGSYSTANSYELERINMANVERIEIIRGPVSSLYGSDALGGVINIITRKSDRQEFTFSLQPSRYTDKTDRGIDNYSLRYDSGQSGKWLWSITADRSDSDLYANADGTSKNQFGRRESLAVDGTYNLAADQYLDLSVNLLREDLHGRSKATLKDPDNSGSTLSVLSNDIYDNRREQYSIGWRGKTANSTYQLRTYYGEQEKENPSYVLSAGSLYGTLHNRDFSRRKTGAVEGSISTQMGNSHLLTTGGEFRREEYTGTRVNPAADSEIDSRALYIQDEWVANDRLLIIPSLRYDDSDKFSGNFSPKLGMTYKMNDQYRLKAGVGKGFKAPTLDDMYMKMSKPMGSMTVNVTGNPDLKPEKSTSYELGIESEKGRNFGKVTYFVNDVTDLISTDMTMGFVPGVGMVATSTYLNEDKADIDGIELEFGRYLSNHFTVKMNYTYLDATDTVGERLTGRAKHQGTVQLHYDSKTANGVSAILWNEWKDSYYYGDDSTTNEKIMKSFARWNVSVTKQWNENFSTYLGVDNIFNKKIDELNMLGAMVQAGMTFKL